MPNSTTQAHRGSQAGRRDLNADGGADRFLVLVSAAALHRLQQRAAAPAAALGDVDLPQRKDHDSGGDAAAHSDACRGRICPRINPICLLWSARRHLRVEVRPDRVDERVRRPGYLLHPRSCCTERRRQRGRGLREQPPTSRSRRCPARPLRPLGP
eukprot:3065759-Rhodomonas_salina.2